MSFDLADVLKGVSNLDTGREQIEYLRLDQIDGDPHNFYLLGGIEDLAANISLCGLQQPVRVRATPEGRYVIVSGHRRRAALELLAQEDPERWAEIPCIVERDAVSPALQQLRLIYANANTRTMTSAELGEQAAQVEKLLYQLKEEGYDFPGRMRDHVAEAVNTSKTKLARLKVIRENLAECWAPHYKDSTLSEFAAYELARLSDDWQQIIFDEYTRKERDYRWLTGDEVKLFAQRAEETSGIICAVDGSPCQNRRNMLEKTVLVSRYSDCPCTKCCDTCYNLASCKNACPLLANKVKQIKASEKAERQQKAQAAEDRDRPVVEYIQGVYTRVGQARKARGVTVRQLYEAQDRVYAATDDKKQVDLETGKAKISAYDTLPFGYCSRFDDAQKLCAVADLLGCSIDYLLGREENVSNSDTKQDAEKVSNSGTWHTGTPEKPGWYICRIEVDGVEKPMYHKHWFGGKTWKGLAEEIQIVTHWVPVVEEIE